MGLAHLEGQALVERVAEQEAMNEAGINARNAHHAAASHGSDALA